MITFRLLEVWKAVATPMIIRPASIEDLPEIIRRMFHFYPGRADLVSLPWMKWVIASQNRLVLIGPNSFGIAQTGMFYGCERRASVDILCSHPVAGGSLECLRMVRRMVAWARRRGAPTLRLDADNGVDFAAFGKRLGARTVTVTKYEIPTR